ncbi:MAG TPA: shikimate dehydrogenase [Tepidisphaeraceae bacterium]|jgi:3-dehydroquinate dehydratase/shikimate dehydrogenase|nr:shikimate dehydrogenase [Tepidisphaeraceae bacterium]
MTRLCVAIFVHSAEQAYRDATLAAEAGADMCELRIDHFYDADEVRALVAKISIPCIITCRPVWEGGRSDLADEYRVPTLQGLASTISAAYVDVELKSIEAFNNVDAPSERNASLIVSSHDFGGRPDRLYNILADLNASPADVAKVVWTARTVRDNIEAFEILLNKQKPTIAICMGEAGVISRILARKFGAFLSFATLEGDGGTAPGQISITDMKRLYRWDAISAQTRVYGVVGSPVGHSMSPAIHNAAFDETGHDGVYVPLLVNPGYESFKAFMETFIAFGSLHLSGLSVTIPHKENCLRYLQEKGADVEPLAESIGAVNTVVIERMTTGEPKLRGFNTDYAAILDSITDALSITRDDLKNYRVAVLGAGGTGRTAVAALAHYGATVVIYNRTRDRADALAAEFNGHSGKVVAAAMEKLCDSCCQIYINTTSVGMHPKVDESPFGDALPKLSADTLVFDAVYNPPLTTLLQQAQSQGARTVSGIEMFVRQAAGQFTAWTNKPAPVATMRRVIESRLSK